tara:strand:- start:444 stop:1415 length:972 start_codon:yes stop_codon:yes gene_type:complete
MSLFDDIQSVGSQLSGFFEEDERNRNRIEPQIPSSINVEDVAAFINPKLHLLDAVIDGNLTAESMSKYKEAKGINDLFRIAAETTYTGSKQNPFETPGQAFNRALSAPQDDTEILGTINQSKAATAQMIKAMGGISTPSIAPRTYSVESQKQDALIPEAFGAWDTLQMGAARVGSAIGMSNLESNRALAAREQLNRDILATGASLYSGRPSKFLLEQIQKTMPIGALEGDDLAYSKYSKLKQIFGDQIQQFKNLLAGAGTASDKTKYAQKLGDLEHMVNRLDVVLGAFEQSGYGREEFYANDDLFAGEFTPEDLDELEDYFGN